MDVTGRLNLRMDLETDRLLHELQGRLGLSRSAAIRYAVRRTATLEGITVNVPLLEGLELRPGPKRQRRGADGG